MTTTRLDQLIHQASVTRAPTSTRSLELAGVLLGDAADARRQVAADAGAQLDRRAVRATRDVVAGREPEAPRVVAREARPRRSGRWNCSSGTRSTAGPEKSGL